MDPARDVDQEKARGDGKARIPASAFRRLSGECTATQVPRGVVACRRDTPVELNARWQAREAHAQFANKPDGRTAGRSASIRGTNMAVHFDPEDRSGLHPNR